MKCRNIMSLLLFLIFCHDSISQEGIDYSIHEEAQNIIDKILYEELQEASTQIQKENQQRITSYENLPGTFWVIEDIMLHPFGIVYDPFAFIFLANNIVLIVRARPLGKGGGYRQVILYSIVGSREYSIVDNKLIIITDFIYGYLENTHLFFGSDNAGYARYRLERTFVPYR